MTWKLHLMEPSLGRKGLKTWGSSVVLRVLRPWDNPKVAAWEEDAHV